MKSTKNIYTAQHSLKIISCLLMCCCLLFLTGVNFIVFPQKADTAISVNHTNKANDKDPSAPVEEKSSSNNTVTVQEEYLHERHTAHEFILLEGLSHHKIHEAEKLKIVHYELVLQPPKA